jgi:N-acetylglucosamine transport system permease protein
MRHGQARFITGFLAIPLALYLFYVVWPFAQTVGYSFTSWGGFSDDITLVGGDNYARLLKDDMVKEAFWHHVFFLVMLPLLTIALALFFSFLLNVGGRVDRAGVRGVWGSNFYKVVFFFPQVLSLVVIGIMWNSIYRGDKNGFINAILVKIGLVDPNDPLGFTSDPTPFLGVPIVVWSLLIVAVWGGVGFYVVLFSAAMSSIPKDIYEAAMLDGAGRFASFFRVTLPLLRESISVAWVYLGFIALDMYALVVTLTPGPGGPNHKSEVFARVINYNAFESGRLGYACAIAVALAVFTLLLASAQLAISRRERLEF